MQEGNALVQRWILTVLALLCMCAVAARGQEGPRTEEFKVIVNAANPQQSIDRVTLGKLFLKRIKRWDHGGEIVPINLNTSSEVRESFSQAIHHKSSWAIRKFWERMIFSGRDLPPEEASSDAEAIAMVAGQRGAIAYVSSSTKLPPGVRELPLVD